MKFIGKILGKILLKTATNAGALYLASRWVSGFAITPHSFLGLDLDRVSISPLLQALIVGGFMLALLNTIVRPILKFFSFPLIILTFGFLHIAINLTILYFANLLTPALTIEGFPALFWGSLLVGIVNVIL